MTARKCPWCGGETLRRVGSNTLQNTEHIAGSGSSYWIEVVYWEDRECGYREVTNPDEVYDYQKSEVVQTIPKVYRVHIPLPPLPLEQQPEHIQKARQKMETFLKKQPVKEPEKQVQQVLP